MSYVPMPQMSSIGFRSGRDAMAATVSIHAYKLQGMVNWYAKCAGPWSCTESPSQQVIDGIPTENLVNHMCT